MNALITANPRWGEGEREKRAYRSAGVSCEWREGEGGGEGRAAEEMWSRHVVCCHGSQLLEFLPSPISRGSSKSD